MVKVPQGFLALLFFLRLRLDQIRNCPALPQAYVYGIIDVPEVGNQILKMSLFTRGIDQKFSAGGTWQLLCLGQEDVAGHWETSNQLPESKDALLYLHQDSAILGSGDVFLPDSVQVSPGF